MASNAAESAAGGADHNGDPHDNEDSQHEEQQPRPAAPAEPPEPAEGEATMLVSEFPPPPYYYTRGENLEPPDIPTAALECGTRRAAAAAARARAEAERLRLSEHMMNNEEEEDKTGAIFGGVVNNANPDDLKDEEGEVVAVFGEIVEDPVLIEPLDYCEDPKVVRAEVKRLNATVLKEFVRLVQDLVHRPLEHKYVHVLISS
jgi:hypothetical protein